MKTILISIMLVLGSNLYCQDTKDEKIRLLLELSGESHSFDIYMRKMVGALKELNSSLPDYYWDELSDYYLDSLKSEIYDQVVPIYSEHLSEKDVENIINFYNSEPGKILTAKQPMILEEVMERSESIGRKFGENIYNSAQNRMKAIFDSTRVDCDCAKEGVFNTYFKGSEYIIERSPKEQFEIFENYRSTYRIKWIDKCRYTLELIKSNDPGMPVEKNGPTSTVSIFGCDSESFEYVIYIKKYDSYDMGKMNIKGVD